MCKKCLRNTQMFSRDVSIARQMNDDLIRWEAEGWGDAGNAMGRVARRVGVPLSKLWALKYRPPKQIASHILRQIEAAHAAAQERELRKLAHDVTLTARVAGRDHPAVAEAAAVLRAHGGAAAADAVAELDRASSGAPSRATGPQISPPSGADLTGAPRR